MRPALTAGGWLATAKLAPTSFVMLHVWNVTLLRRCPLRYCFSFSKSNVLASLHANANLISSQAATSLSKAYKRLLKWDWQAGGTGFTGHIPTGESKQCPTCQTCTTSGVINKQHQELGQDNQPTPPHLVTLPATCSSNSCWRSSSHDGCEVAL